MGKEFGFWLADIREKRGFGSQRLLALAADVSNATISRIESGTQEPTPKTLKKLAPHLGVAYEELMTMAGYLSINFGRTDDPTPPNNHVPHKPSSEVSAEEMEHIMKRRRLNQKDRQTLDIVADRLCGDDEQAAAKV